MSTLILMQGPSGSGKTTLARRLVAVTAAVIVSADDYFKEWGEYRFAAGELHYAHMHCQAACAYWLRRDQPVIVDNTNVTIKAMQPYWDMAEFFNVEQRLVVRPNWVLAPMVQLVREWADRNTHGVPYKTVLRQATQLVDETHRMRIVHNVELSMRWNAAVFTWKGFHDAETV